jgi:hypothetical protein
MADTRAYQAAFTAGELSPALWARVDLAKYDSGMKTAINLYVHPHGGASNRAGLEFVGEVKDSAKITRLVPFQFNTEQSYQLEFGDLYMRVWRDGGLVLHTGVPFVLTTPFLQTEVNDLVFIQEADVMYMCHPMHPVYKLGRLADDNWTLTTVTFAPKMTAPGAPTVTKPGDTSSKPGYVATTYTYCVSAVADDTSEESLPSGGGSVVNDLSIATGINRVAWSAVAGAGRYIVYKLDNGVFGYIGGTTGLSFDDENITADLSDTPQTARNPFNSPGNYPSVCTFIEQRLGFAATLNDPQAVWLSQSANYENFGYSSPAKASDAVTFRVKSRQINQIRSMIATKGLMLLSSSAEWVVTGGSQSDAIAPSAIKIDNQGYRGCAKVQPVVVGNVVLFAQRLGGVIRDFSYDFSQDTYVGKDLTILARHLFENKTIVAMGFAQAPDSIVWVVLDDGSLVSLTYMKEQDVWAWTRHQSAANAFFEDVSIISEGTEDVPYFIVRRTINGQVKRYIERLHTRVFADISDAFFVDCGLTYDGAPVSHLSGLDHLEGQELVALADGNVIRNLTVDAGAITMPVAASKIQIGLPITSSLQSLDIDLGNVNGLGTIQGRKKSVANVVLRVQDTRGIFIGAYDGDRESMFLVEYKQRATEAWGAAIQPYSGDIEMTPMWDWNVDGNMWIKQFDPLPMTILALMPDLTLGA